MVERRTVTAYIDYKSPYAYLAKDPAYEFERDFGVYIDWLPYVLDIPSFLGSARVDEAGRVIEDSATRISSGGSATATWTAVARPENAVS